MKLLKTMLAGAAASVGAAVQAQTPADLPPLPDAPPVVSGPDQPPAADVVAAPMLPPGGQGPCTPGHCTHRLAIARRRCRRHLQEVFLGYPEEFERPALGATLHAINSVSVGNAEAGTMILRPFDFEPGTTRLNLRGGDKLREIGMRLPTSFAPVIVERTRNASLDESRRSAVLAALGSDSFPVPPERVVIGRSISTGLNGEEALLIDGTELNRTRNQGPDLGSGVSASSPAGAR